jgi:hypothetical protein
MVLTGRPVKAQTWRIFPRKKVIAMTHRSWRRWQDWAAVVIGVLAALSPIVLTVDTAAMWALIAFGVLLVASALWSLAAPGSVASEYVHMGLGVLMFISPWVLGYTDLLGASWTSWIAGVLGVAVGVAALPAAQEEHRHHRGLLGQH